ncbi:MAG: ATP-binding protein [Kineosporiaceae bacterium]
MPTSTYVPRLLDQELADAVGSHPAVLVVGPRACGKTTTARRLCRSALRLDVPAQAAAVRADPDAALRDLPEPLLIDEWQLVPEIMGAVKRTVDEDPRAGRFVLTGSSQADLTASGWPATGRIVRLVMFPLVGRERHGEAHVASLVDRLLDEGLGALGRPANGWDIRSYVADALIGGYPEATQLAGDRARDRWLSGYLDHLVTREVPALGLHRDPVRLRRYVHTLAANSAGAPVHKLLYDTAGIERATAVAYDDLLDMLFVTHRVPAWTGRALDRGVRLPKRYVVDPGLMVAQLRTDSRRVLRDGNLLGRVIDTYVAAHLRAECAISTVGADLFHLRDANGRREVDLVLEARDGRVLGVEVKAGAAPSPADARHLAWLRDRLGDRFTAGLVVHTGPRAFRLDERISAVPISSLWT